jgi:hypothetical protein
MAITTIISPMPTPAPSKEDPVNFNPLADATLLELEDKVTELNAYATEANATADAVNVQANLAAANATTANNLSAAVSAQGPAVAYNSGTTYDFPDLVYGTDGRLYRCLAYGISADNPVTSITGAWAPVTPDPRMVAWALMGGAVYPGWNVELQNSDGTYPPTDAAHPAQVVVSRGVERYKTTFTWGTTGADLDSVVSAALYYSSNSGGTWAPVVTENIVTITRSTGAVGAAWSAS